jgi:hypothetical protein
MSNSSWVDRFHSSDLSLEKPNKSLIDKRKVLKSEKGDRNILKKIRDQLRYSHDMMTNNKNRVEQAM